MKSKPNLNPESDSDTRRSGRTTETSPSSTTTIRNRISTRNNSSGKRNSTQTASPSPGPTRTPTTGPGRTPQTKRRELTLSQNSPSGSPRSREFVKPQNPARKPTQARSKADANGSSEDSCRKSSNSSQDSGIGREVRPVVRSRPGHSAAKTRNTPIIRTISPETVEIEVSNRKKFEELCDVKNVEMGIVKVPPELLNDLIHKGSIESYYDVDAIPVASGLFATVKKCTHKETGVEYAAKFSSRVRCGVDCTTEVLHEIALLSICAESSKIVHLKDVFQNKHEIVLVLEYAPGGDFQTVLDDDMVPFEQDVQGFILQLLEALAYIHQRKIAHLDIKPQNIVLMSEFPNCEIKLCDLEVSRVIQDTEHIREIIGTPDYVAPEILGMEPITLAADIWSLGVLAYVLLTGFSPFGGDTDQETLRNITTAPLDFPGELFEGVSEDAKDFITQCLNRNPKKRPTVDECLQHPWISQNQEPPSPSPLMLKIPAPDHYGDAPSGSSRRSCQTCRDKITERKRYLSKSREAIFEKVANSNLKKSLSKSRERLCDMRLTLSKSRDYLNESKIASRSQEKFYGFKNLSKSQEVLSQALGGNMKRMVNGAVSDISPAHLPVNPRMYLDSSSANLPANPRVYLDSPDSCDFVILPGSTVLMSHSDLMNLSSPRSADSLQLLPGGESGRSTPSSHPPPSSQISESQIDQNCGSGKHAVETLIEVSEDEGDEHDDKENSNVPEVILRRDRDTKSCEKFISSESKASRRKSSHEARNTITAKDEKNNINYETKQSMSRSASADGIHNNYINKGKTVGKSETAEVAVQVNLSKCNSSPSVSRKERSGLEGLDSNRKLTSLASTDDLLDGNSRAGVRVEKRLRRGFSHDDTLGEESKRYSWREELERFRNMKKPLGVSDLIDTFTNKSNTRKVSSDDPSFSSIESLKNRRRGSLQIQINSKELAKLSEKAEDEKSRIAAKLQRRKSTSAILPLRSAEVKMPDIAEDAGQTLDKLEDSEPGDAVAEKTDVEKDTGKETAAREEVTKDDPNKIKSNKGQDTQQNPNKGRVYLEKVNERKRTWDYFEINHPKAISDKKLEQLKAKYTRRKTETSLHTQQKSDTTSEPGKIFPPVPSRTNSMPVMKLPKETEAEPPSVETESVDSGKGGENTREPSVCSTDDLFRKESTGSRNEVSSKVDNSVESEDQKKNKEKNRRNSLLNRLSQAEQTLSGDSAMECFIDPFTGQFITSKSCKESRDLENCREMTADLNMEGNLRVKVPREPVQPQDDGIGSLPDTPTDLGKNKSLSVKEDFSEDAQLDEVVLRTGSGGGDSSDSASDRLSAVSIEEPFESTAFRQEGHRRPLAGKGDDNQRPRSNSGARERAKATKVCSGSFSRGFQRFRSESPVLVKTKPDT